jgi:hypothetical protein
MNKIKVFLINLFNKLLKRDKMKHYRDLVLSTKEPLIHNVLWIKPMDEVGKYKIFMFEGDGWLPLYGSDSAYSSLDYNTLKKLPDGYIIQLLDNPFNDKDRATKLYPVTKGSYVYLNNGLTLEEYIMQIN